MGEFLQKQFDQFHDKIKQDSYNSLREKRKMLIKELKDWLKDNKKPRFSKFNQGSYSMKTTISPLEGEDYDLDVGLEFHISAENYEAFEVKQWVFDAFQQRQNRTVEYKTSCVRVQYIKDGDPRFHIDFAIYGRKDKSKPKENLFLAKGKQNSSDKNKIWEKSSPFSLKDKMNEAFEKTDERRQMRRCIRALKRWKDFKFTEGNGRPLGIAITACVLKWFQPFVTDPVSQESKVSDLKALDNLVRTIVDNNYGLDVTLPVEPYNDLFAKIKNNSVNTDRYKKCLEELRDALKNAIEEDSERDASKILEKHFGEDFPIPDEDKPIKSSRPAIAPSIGSA